MNGGAGASAPVVVANKNPSRYIAEANFSSFQYFSGGFYHHPRGRGAPAPPSFPHHTKPKENAMINHSSPTHFSVDENGSLACPTCGDYQTHMNVVVTEAFHAEDIPAGWAITDSSGHTEPLRMGDCGAEFSGGGRRHSFAIVGYCESNSHPFAVKFSQHKGNTLVDVVQLGTDAASAVLGMSPHWPEHCSCGS